MTARPRRVVFFLHSNIRSGANLVMLRHAVSMSASAEVLVVFQHDWFGTVVDYVPGHGRLTPLLLRDYHPAAWPPADAAVTNWWECAYAFPDIPARHYVYYRHGDERSLYGTPLFDALFGWIERERFTWLCVNDHLARPLRAAGHDPAVLPPGVDLSAFRTATPSLPPRQGKLRVLVEGPAGAPHKRVAATLDMLRTLDGVETVHMAGDGPRAGNADHTLGAIPHADVPGVYAACDVLVKLSAAEAFPMPVLEQFAAGGTAVVTAFPGHDALLAHGRNALLVDLDAPFGPARDAVAALRDDPALLARLRQAARLEAARYDWAGLHAAFAQIVLRPPLAEGVQALPIAAAYRACAAATVAQWAAATPSRQSAS